LRRSIIIALGVLAAVIIALACSMFVLSPPVFPSEILLRKGPVQSDWSAEVGDMTIRGSTIWSNYAYYPGESVRLYRSVYLGAIPFTEDGLNWINDQGNVEEKALTLDNLTARWQYEGTLVPTSQQNGSSTFKYILDEHNLRVVFTIPREGDGYKYQSLDKAWEAGELYLTISGW
jgi:hypothetical protein